MTRTCDDCRFAVLTDEGYSNYTVEGTTFECALRVHPDGAFDHWYGEDKRSKYAQQCPEFTEGGFLHIDVERENIEHFTKEEREVYDIHLEGKGRPSPW